MCFLDGAAQISSSVLWFAITSRHVTASMAGREEARRQSQTFATPGDSGTHSPHWKFCNRRNLIVLHPLNSDKQDHRALLVGQPYQGPRYIAKLEPRQLVWRLRRICVELLRLCDGALACTPAKMGYMLVV